MLFGDMNEVLNEQERHGSIFSRNEVDIFNSFINTADLIDLPLGGRTFTWMNKLGTKLSKLDRFLISEDVLNSLLDICVTALDRLWSDHNPILLHCNKADFGSIPFKLYHYWFSRDGFDITIKTELANLVHDPDGRKLLFHEKLKRLKLKVKQWHILTKCNEGIRKQEIVNELKKLEENIEAGMASTDNLEAHIKLLQEMDTIDNFNAMDTIQKARIKWDIEGDENTKFFHGLVNKKCRSQSINGIIHEGIWITEPYLVKEAFLNFFKEKL